MKLKYTYILFTALTACYFVPATAQVKSTTKKGQKTNTPASQNNAKKLGDAASKTTQDTTKKAGQNPNEAGAISEEIVVTTSYKPVLADAVKIRRNPDLEDKTPFKAPLTYSSVDKRLTKDNEIQQLEAMKRPPERDSIPTNNYVKGGLGSMKTTFGEGYFSNGADEALQVGGYVKHFSQGSSSFNKQNESRNELGVFGKSITDEHTLRGTINYKRRGVNFYGYNRDIEPPLPEFNPQKQAFNTLSAEGELAKNYRDVENDFTYALKLNGYVFNNSFNAKENNLVLSGFVNQTVKQFYAGLAASLDLGTQKDSLYSYSNSIIRLNPYIKFQGEKYKIDAGVNITKEFGLSSRFSIFPAAKLEFQVIPKYVRLFAEAKGDINKASIRDFAEANPFIAENITLKNSADRLALSAGLKGTLAPGLGFKATFFRNRVKDMPLYIANFNTNSTNNKFAVIYDDGTATVSGFTGELDFKATDDLNIFGRAEFKDYKMDTEEQAWNLPKFKLTAGTIIRISDKVNINGSLLVRGNAYDRIFDPLSTTFTEPRAVEIKSYVDLNGGAEYKATKQLSIFVQVNNILNNSNPTYLYYNNYGFNIFGGVGYAF
ncbi:TonB-dependent receptor [Mucilaginibacter sp. UR6-1]|uniref:TonB-dependent receptor n=1 Tax=Mucilaginibacter sp. UR6-1 TaxID=1435643 RepID=UPI001E557CD0|nr:TonB-dependent receptor [Mucilaginibacter sp. UR6-1]MCC8408838.1 TonB-dependent receptor [Mucilaginibacter sp. UR6-1]